MSAKFVTILVAAALASCATTAGYESMLQTWVGSSTDQLVSRWGPPQSSYRLSNDGSVLEYTRSGTVVIPGITTTQAVTSYQSGSVSTTGSYGGDTTYGAYNGTSTTYVPHTTPSTVIAQSCTTRFTTDAAGTITNWAWEGNACRANPPKKN